MITDEQRRQEVIERATETLSTAAEALLADMTDLGVAALLTHMAAIWAADSGMSFATFCEKARVEWAAVERDVVRA